MPDVLFCAALSGYLAIWISNEHLQRQRCGGGRAIWLSGYLAIWRARVALAARLRYLAIWLSGYLARARAAAGVLFCAALSDYLATWLSGNMAI
jgi:hypothetical protein